jgi:uncharacterized protein
MLGKLHRLLFLCCALLASASAADEGARVVQTPYTEQRVVFDFFFDEPAKIGPALFWIRSLLTPLSEPPYGMAPEMLDLKVVVHGTEIVTLARHNYEKYREAVERMRYYAELGVEFLVCGLAAQDYDYTPADFYPFVHIVPSAITELAHWQMQGYALVTPQVMERKFAIEEIR